MEHAEGVEATDQRGDSLHHQAVHLALLLQRLDCAVLVVRTKILLYVKGLLAIALQAVARARCSRVECLDACWLNPGHPHVAWLHWLPAIWIKEERADEEADGGDRYHDDRYHDDVVCFRVFKLELLRRRRWRRWQWR